MNHCGGVGGRGEGSQGHRAESGGYGTGTERGGWQPTGFTGAIRLLAVSG